MKDYYRIAGVFASVRQTTRPIIPEEEVAKTQPARDEVNKIEEANKKLTDQNREATKRQRELDFQLKEVMEDKEVKITLTAKEDGTKRTPLEQTQLEIAQNKQKTAEISKQLKENKATIEKIKKETPGYELPVAHALTEEQIRVEEQTKERMNIVYYPKPRDLNIFIRGDAGNLGSVVPRGYIEVLSPDSPIEFQQGSGRLELAKLIASDSNPLTARVIVNRIWMQHFGKGIVLTPSNFGENGDRPSHPELLDDLSVRFMNHGWSMKWLHREIMLSATYQQSSSNKNTGQKLTIDPDNRLQSHFNRQRLGAESYRDSLLAVANTLDRKLTGPSGDADSSSFNRRAIYSKVSRHQLSIYLQSYDFPDPAIHASTRTNTTTPLQQLFVMNSEFFQNQAMAFAKRFNNLPVNEKIDVAYKTLFSRNPTDIEREIGTSYLQATQQIEQEEFTSTGTAPTFSGKRIRTNLKQLGDTYSIEMWIRNTLPNNNRPITGYFFSRGSDNPKTDHGDHLGISGTHRNGPNGRLLFFNGGKQKQSFIGKTTLKQNTWNHVVFTRKDQSVQLFLNGNPTPEISTKAKIGYENNSPTAFLGGRNDNFANFIGQINAVSVYDRQLLPEELLAHYQSAHVTGDSLDISDYSKSVLSSKPKTFWMLSNDNPKFNLATDLGPHQLHSEYEGRPAKPSLLETRWQKYCHALLSSNEMIFID